MVEIHCHIFIDMDIWILKLMIWKRKKLAMTYISVLGVLMFGRCVAVT